MISIPVHAQIKRESGLRLESISRFSSIPIVESSIKTGVGIYQRVKYTNSLITWTLDTSEHTALAVMDSLRPAVRIIQGPLQKIDEIGMAVLDMVEQKAPMAYLPPQMIYFNTKEYVSDRVVKPVMKRADSFGDLVDGAIERADNVVDKYLPESEAEQTNDKSTTTLATCRTT